MSCSTRTPPRASDLDRTALRPIRDDVGLAGNADGIGEGVVGAAVYCSFSRLDALLVDQGLGLAVEFRQLFLVENRLRIPPAYVVRHIRAGALRR